MSGIFCLDSICPVKRSVKRSMKKGLCSWNEIIDFIGKESILKAEARLRFWVNRWPKSGVIAWLKSEMMIWPKPERLLGRSLK